MKSTQFINEGVKLPKPKTSKATGNEFIKFKVPSNLNTTKNLDATIAKIVALIDAVSTEYVGVQISGLIVTPNKFNLYDASYFKAADGTVCKVYGTDTEVASGFSLIIAKLTTANAKKVPSANIVQPIAASK